MSSKTCKTEYMTASLQRGESGPVRVWLVDAHPTRALVRMLGDQITLAYVRLSPQLLQLWFGAEESEVRR